MNEPTKNPAAVALGRLGGQSKSAAKRTSSRANAIKASNAALIARQQNKAIAEALRITGTTGI